MDFLAVPYAMTVLNSSGVTASANLLNERLGRTALFTGAAPYATFDLGSSKPVDVLALLATDLDGDDTIQWIGSNNSDMSSPVHSVTYSPAVASPSIAITRIHRQHMVKLSSPITARYWRAVLGASSATRRIGRAVISKAFEPAEPRDYGWDFGVVDLGENEISKTGLDDAQVLGKVLRFSWVWSGLTKTEAMSLAIDVMAYAGVTRNVLFCADPTDSAVLHNIIGYGKLTEPAKSVNYAEGWYELSCSLLSRLVLSL